MPLIKNLETPINPVFEDFKRNLKQEETSDFKKESQAINGM